MNAKKHLLAACLAAGTSPAWAGTNECAVLPTVVVEASRIGLEAESVPAHVDVYGPRAIAESGAQTVADFLRKGANLSVRTMNANPMQAQVALRGYGEYAFGRCKVLLDGEELNTVEMEMPNLMRIPLDQAARIEILHGPQTVLHGDGASAGVVNVETDRSGEEKTKVAARGGSEGTFGASVRRSGKGTDESVAYRANYDYLRSDGYRENAAYQTHTAGAGVRKTFAGGSYLGVNANYAWLAYQMPGALTEAQYARDFRQSVRPDDWARAHAYGVGLESKAVLDDDTSIRTDVGYAQKDRHVWWGGDGYANDYRLNSVRFAPRLVCEYPWFGHDNKLTVGADLAWDHYEVRNGSAYAPSAPFFDRYRAARYLHDEFFLTDELSVLAGTRSEGIWSAWRRYDGLAHPRSDTFEWAYEAGLVYRPADGLKLYLRQTRFYRAPFCDEISYADPGDALKPESGYSADLGVQYAFWDDFRATFDGYGTWTQDEIFYNPYFAPSAWGWSGYNCNAPSDTQRLGFDLGLAWERTRRASASVKYSFVDARFLNGQYANKEVPLVPSSRLRAEAAYWALADVPVRLGYQFVGAQRFGGDYRNQAGRLEAFSLFDASVGYEPQSGALAGLKVTVSVDNLFDLHYCDYAGYSDYSGRYYYPAAGRTFAVTVSYAF